MKALQYWGFRSAVRKFRSLHDQQIPNWNVHQLGRPQSSASRFHFKKRLLSFHLRSQAISLSSKKTYTWSLGCRSSFDVVWREQYQGTQRFWLRGSVRSIWWWQLAHCVWRYRHSDQGIQKDNNSKDKPSIFCISEEVLSSSSETSRKKVVFFGRKGRAKQVRNRSPREDWRGGRRTNLGARRKSRVREGWKVGKEQKEFPTVSELMEKILFFYKYVQLRPGLLKRKWLWISRKNSNEFRWSWRRPNKFIPKVRLQYFYRINPKILMEISKKKFNPSARWKKQGKEQL